MKKTLLTEANVIEIRRLKQEGWLQKDMAKKFGVSNARISNVILNKSRVL